MREDLWKALQHTGASAAQPALEPGWYHSCYCWSVTTMCAVLVARQSAIQHRRPLVYVQAIDEPRCTEPRRITRKREPREVRDAQTSVTMQHVPRRISELNLRSRKISSRQPNHPLRIPRRTRTTDCVTRRHRSRRLNANCAKNDKSNGGSVNQQIPPPKKKKKRYR